MAGADVRGSGWSAQAVEDQPICEIEPRKAHSCDETEVIAAEIKRLRGLERYVDAQSGGPGRGWLRIVEHPREARDVIERQARGGDRGRVVEPLRLQRDPGRAAMHPQGRRSRPRAAKRRGIRSVFIAHWVDNAFAGAALEGGDKGAFINVFNRYQTGHYFRTAACPYEGQGEEPDPLNAFEMGVLAQFFPRPRRSLPSRRPATRRAPMQRQGPDEARRLPGPAADRRAHADRGRPPRRVGAKAGAGDRGEADYPLVSGHSNTGGTWTPEELQQLYRLGGIAAATPAQAPQLAAKFATLRGYQGRRRAGVPLGTDTGGFSSLPEPRDDAATNPLPYPFRSYDGKVTFDRQTTGERSFDLNTDGVAHYGLFADLIADMQRYDGGEPAARSPVQPGRGLPADVAARVLRRLSRRNVDGLGHRPPPSPSWASRPPGAARWSAGAPACSGRRTRTGPRARRQRR